MSRFPTRSLRSTPADITPIVLVIIAVSTIARLLFATGLDYGVDEAYAVSVGRTFQLSFFDHPPIAFWTAGIMEALFGSHAPHWLIRLQFILAFSGTLYLIYALTRRLFSPEAGLWAVVLLSLAPFFFASAGSWIVPDGPVDLFLAASALLLARILFDDASPEESDMLWGLLGVTFGLAALSKYHAFLFAAGAVIFLIATPHRRHLLRPAPWLAGLVALALFSPVIWWNATHGWISIAFQSGRSHVEGGLYPVHILQTLAGQAAYLWPWTLIIAAWALIRALAGQPAWIKGDHARQKAWFLGSLALPAILLFTILPLFGSRGLPHWPMPGWLFAFPLAGAMAAHARAAGRRWPIWLASASAGLLAIAGISVVLILQSSIVAGLLLRTPGMLDGRGVVAPLITEAADWKGLRLALADRDLAPIPDRFVVALKWHEAARISAELGAGPIVTVFDADARGFAFLTDQRVLLGQDAVIITDWRPALTIDTEMKPYFDSVDPPELVTLSVAGGIPKTLSVTLAHKLVKPFPLKYGPTAGGGK
jgi:hypothetical protein